MEQKFEQVLPIGTKLNSGKREYTIKKVLGQGGFGITYLASAKVLVDNIPFEVLFAIKEHYLSTMNSREGASVVISNENNTEEIETSIESFLVEAHRLNRLSLNHPGLVRVNECFRANGTAYYVMEYVKGTSLRHYIKDQYAGKPLTEGEALSLFHQIAETVGYLHDNRVTHLDIKPDNILMREDGSPVLIDFGLSKHYNKQGGPTSTTKMMGCSAGYSPMEQYVGINSFTPEADIYALCATLLYMLTGKDPRISTEMNETIIRNSLPTDTSTRTCDMIVKGMEKLKENRFHSITSLELFGKGKEPVFSAPHDNGDKTDRNKTKPLRKEEQKQEKFVKAEKNGVADKKTERIKEPTSSPQFKPKSFRWFWIVSAVAVVALVVGLLWTANSGQSSQDGDKASQEGEQANHYTELPAEQKAIIQNLINNMVPVEGGTFTMGATSEQGSDAWEYEKPAHQVTLSSFSIGKYEVTQEEWEAVMGSNPSRFKGAKRPVEQVSWDDCQEFIRKLNALTGKQFRLPTEAEWEYAARGGNRSRGYKYSGNDNLGSVAWHYDNSGNTTHPVGQKQSNELGLYDLSGNVFEWCQDWDGDYSSSAQKNPTGPGSGSDRVSRGGGWAFSARNFRVSNRGCYAPSARLDYLGLRLAL